MNARQAELEYMLKVAAEELARIASFVEFYHGKPGELENWAKRIRSNAAPNSVCLPANLARSIAGECFRVLADAEAPENI